MEVREITLLSLEEYNANCRFITNLDNWWWLRSPGYYGGGVACVLMDGDIEHYGFSEDSERSVRPALRIVPENGIEKGDRILAGGMPWTVISENLLLCDQSIGEMAFRNDCQTNKFELSDVKKLLDSWAAEKGLIGEVRLEDIQKSPRLIRFIDSRYNELFRIPDNSTILTTQPDRPDPAERQFVSKCSYLDDYHFQIGYEIYHICQFAEKMERNGWSCRPEPETEQEKAAWRLKDNYLLFERSEEGFSFEILTYHFDKKKSGTIQDPTMTMNMARERVLELELLNISNMSRFPISYEDVKYCASMSEGINIEGAWQMGEGYLLIHNCEDGWYYRVCDASYTEIDGGVLTNFHMNLMDAKKEIKELIGIGRNVKEKPLYEDEHQKLINAIEEAEDQRMKEIAKPKSADKNDGKGKKRKRR